MGNGLVKYTGGLAPTMPGAVGSSFIRRASVRRGFGILGAAYAAYEIADGMSEIVTGKTLTENAHGEWEAVKKWWGENKKGEPPLEKTTQVEPEDAKAIGEVVARSLGCDPVNAAKYAADVAKAVRFTEEMASGFEANPAGAAHRALINQACDDLRYITKLMGFSSNLHTMHLLDALFRWSKSYDADIKAEVADRFTSENG